MKKLYFTLLAAMALTLGACSSSNDPDIPEPTPTPTPTPEPEPEPEPDLTSQGWANDYSGVMLQGFSWDSYNESQWKVLARQVDDLKGYIDLVWLPQSGKCMEATQVMGYMPYYYFNQNSSFGSEAELRSLITKFKAAGIGAIADVVVNHRNTDGWYNFPAETYKGVTYQMQPTDICKNDDGGETATQAAKDGVSLSQNNDEGTDFGGCRDIDHKSENVQKVIKPIHILSCFLALGCNDLSVFPLIGSRWCVHPVACGLHRYRVGFKFGLRLQQRCLVAGGGKLVQSVKVYSLAELIYVDRYE